MTPLSASRPSSFRRPTRWNLLSRLLAAGPGGYALGSMTSAFLALSLPMAREEAVLFASFVGFLVYPAAWIWAFAARTPRRAWIGMLLPAVLQAAGIWILRRHGWG